MVTVAGRRGDRRWVTSGGVSSVAARTDHGARFAYRSGHPHIHSLPLTAARYGGHPGWAQRSVPHDIGLTVREG